MGSMVTTDPTVDVIVPLHTTDRAVDVAVSSAQAAHQGIATRVLVVLHDIAPADRSKIQIESPAVVLHCDDGLRSPSGPRNVGLDAATAPFVFFLDSDDRLAKNCLGLLHEVAAKTDADVVLPSLRIGARYVGTPLAWSRRPRRLEVVNHDLFLRSHVPALLRRTMLERTGVRYPLGIRTGEDFAVMARLLAFEPAALALDAVYEVLDDAADRASSPLPAHEQLAALRMVLSAGWMDALPEDARELLVRRILSVGVAGAWRRAEASAVDRSSEEHAAVRDAALERCPSAHRLLSVRDRVSLRFSEEPGRIERLLRSAPLGLVPSSFRGAGPRGPLVREARSWVVRHRRRRIGAT